jgi:hypothetical protein
MPSEMQVPKRYFRDAERSHSGVNYKPNPDPDGNGGNVFRPNTVGAMILYLWNFNRNPKKWFKGQSTANVNKS